MSAYREPLVVPTARTLLILHHWPSPRSARARPNLRSLAVMDFLLRFPVALERLFELRDREMPTAIRPTTTERGALENEHLALQLSLWPSRHRLVAGGLLGRELARMQPALSGTGLALTARGAQIAADIATAEEWRRVDGRARALARTLRVGAPQLPALASRAVAATRSPMPTAFAGQK